MGEADQEGALHVPERAVPVPAHLSAEAKAFLSLPASAVDRDYPALDDADGWRRYIAARDAGLMEMFFGDIPAFPCSVRDIHEDGVRGYELVPEGVDAADGRVYFDIHGGGFIMGGGEVCKAMAMSAAAKLKARVIAVDYRMPPDHPYPAGLDDCLTFYRALLRDYSPTDIIVGGGSAGANLAAATILRARDEGLPLPGAAVLLSPEADLTESGDSFHTNAGLDGMGSLMQANLLYAGGHDLANPYLSPLFADFTKGFPPTFVSAGTRDLFLSNAARMHRALREARIPAELHILEAAAHAGFGGWSPEEAAISREMKSFCDAKWAAR